MTWNDIHYNKLKPTHTDNVLEYIEDEIIPKLKSKSVAGSTKHHCLHEYNNQKYIICSSPAYRSDSGQLCNV